MELPGYSNKIEKMIIGEGFGNDLYGYLEICNYPNLQKIVINSNSFQNINSLTICNNNELEVIEIKNQSCRDVKRLCFSCINHFYSS